MEVEIVEVRALALLHLKTQRHPERLFAGSADPEEPFAVAVHLDHPLFDAAGLDHQIMDADLERRLQSRT